MRYQLIVEVTPTHYMDRLIKRSVDVKIEPDLSSDVRESSGGAQTVQSTTNVLTKLLQNAICLSFTLQSGFAVIQKPMQYYLQVLVAYVFQICVSSND